MLTKGIFLEVLCNAGKLYIKVDMVWSNKCSQVKSAFYTFSVWGEDEGKCVWWVAAVNDSYSLVEQYMLFLNL